MSQLSTNYQQATNTYSTTWAEPGINCETCHGPSESHNRLARATPAGQPMADPSIISTKTMTTQQRNDLCLSSCHAKAHPLTSTFPPGKRFFDHFDPITLEDNDYYPDGRDLGENYTFTSWNMSPCVKSGKTRLHALPHLQRPLSFQKRELQQFLYALPYGEIKKAGRAHPPSG